MTFIIAEVGSNWTTLDEALASIGVAKDCGADAVKFQLYSHKELYGFDDQPWTTADANHPGYHMYIDRFGRSFKVGDVIPLMGELPREWVPQLAKKCQEVGIEFMCSAFSPQGIQFLDPYVKRHKIASAELTHDTMLRVAKASGKPLLLSMGGSTMQEIGDALKLLSRDRTTLLYCVAAYPAKDVTLDGIHFLVDRFQLPVGYSCHTDEIATPYYAARWYGAPVIEKHFKLRDMATPDNGHAITPDKFKEMVGWIRREKAFAPIPHPLEADMVNIHKRRYRPELGGYYRGKA